MDDERQCARSEPESGLQEDFSIAAQSKLRRKQGRKIAVPDDGGAGYCCVKRIERSSALTCLVSAPTDT